MKQFFIKHFALVISFLFLILATSMAQVGGIITDGKTGKPLVGVKVFVNKTTIGTQSDEAGQFKLENVLTGFQEIILYKNGYSIYRSSMKIQTGRAYNLKLSLTASKKKKTTRLTEEEKASLKSKVTSAKAASELVTIINEKDIEISVAEGQRVLVSKTPLTIQNDATGYLLKYYAMELPLPEISLAPIKYELLPAVDVKQNIAWEKNRKNYFQGSQRHWLMALVADQLKEEGYSILDEKGNEADVKALISTSSLAGYSKLTISQPLTILYKKEDGSIQTSSVATNIPVDVNVAGLPINSKALLVEGDMAKAGLADQLPIDYLPIAGDVENTYAQTIERFYEKVYVHTDKPYYYPGEPMWFKGYINYKEPKWRDSLSKVMYVELINPRKEISLTKTLKIDSGFFYNDFILPDTLKEGTYYLRAYTNLNRDFGDSNLFVKPIPIINITDKVDHTQGKMEEVRSSFLSISTDKKIYKTREKITLTLQVKDKEGKPLTANLSISVTDAIQVVPIAEPVTIMDGYPFKKESQRKAVDLKYPVEYGVGFSGKFLNDNGKPEKTTLTILQMKPRNMMLAASNEQGIFSITGLDFYDTAMFSFKADKAKDYPYGKVDLQQREIPPMSFRDNAFNLTVQNTQSQQRIISEYEVPKDVRLLQSVEVKASRIEEQYEKDYRMSRPYGKADHVLKSKDINTSYGNLIYALVGKIPGLKVNPERGTIGFSRAATQSISFGGDPLVTINDVAMGGDAYQTISTINPSTVESIEFTNRLNVLYGSQGANGVISIYTKQGTSEDELRAPNFQTVKIAGYSSLRNFRYPDYRSKETDVKKADYRSTIYWNPEVTSEAEIDTATVSFFSADLPGKYRMVAEGVNEKGEPVRYVLFLEIENE
ncbi:MAG: carboxypeptidase-like regulatory domain-containing protein [Bacteroidota bacterium]